MSGIGQNLQSFTGNGDASIWEKNSREGRKTPCKQTNKQTNKQFCRKSISNLSTETIKDYQGTLTKWQITIIFSFIHIGDDNFINVIIHGSGDCPVIFRFRNVKPVGEFKLSMAMYCFTVVDQLTWEKCSVYSSCKSSCKIEFFLISWKTINYQLV